MCAVQTVGYGDMSLQYESSRYVFMFVSSFLRLHVNGIDCNMYFRIFSIFYIITSVIVVAGAIGNFGAVQLAMAFEKKKEEALNKELDLESLLAMVGVEHRAVVCEISLC